MNPWDKWSHFVRTNDKDGNRFYGPPEKPFTYPSVTSILDVTSATDKGIQQWMMKVGAKVYSETMDAAAKFGSECHDLFERVLKGEPVEIPVAYEKHVTAFREWVAEHKVKPVATEFILVSERYGYAGTVDALCEVDGRLEIVDWKTGNNYRDSWASQVGAYHLAFTELLQSGHLTPEQPKIDMSIGGRILHIARDTAKKKEFKFQHLDFIEDSFLLHLEMFKRAPRFKYLQGLGWNYVTQKALIRSQT